MGDILRCSAYLDPPTTDTQLFSDPGKERNPFWGRPSLVGQPPTKRKKGATEQLRINKMILALKSEWASRF